MSKKLNGYAKWILIALAVLTVVFNTGVTYNHIHNLTESVERLTVAVDKMDGSIDDINIKLAERSSQ